MNLEVRALCQGWCLVAETVRRGAEIGFLSPIGTLLRTGPWISRLDAIVIVVVQMSACEVTRYNAPFGAEGSRGNSSAFQGRRRVRHRRLTQSAYEDPNLIRSGFNNTAIVVTSLRNQD